MPVLMGDDDGSWRRGSTEEGQLEEQLADMRFDRDCARATIAEQDKRILMLEEQLAEARKQLDAHNDADRLYAIPSIQDTLSDDVKETHHALLSDDVVFLLLSRLAQWDGIGAAAACKIWQSQWKRRCAGMLRLARHRVGAFRSCDHVVANPGGGVIVSDYHKSRLMVFSPEGESLGAFHAGSPRIIWTPWCAGPLSIYTELGKPPEYTYVSLFLPFSGDEQGPPPRAA